MNAYAVFLVLVVVPVAFAFGFPATDDFRLVGLRMKMSEEVGSEPFSTSEEDETGVRVRRATCDLLSISTAFGSLNHAACAAHCLSKRKGFKGGRCINGVCHCRK